MGTKNNPGLYDCHAKAAGDEPVFTLLARDPLAPKLIEIWAALAGHNFAAAEALLWDAVKLASALPKERQAKVLEAFACADEMTEWSDLKSTPRAIAPAATGAS